MSTLSNFGIPGIINGHLNPKLSDRWRAVFVGIGGLPDSKDLSAQLVNFQKPNPTFQEVPIYRYNSTSYIAGKSTFEPISITVENDVDGRAAAIINAQYELQKRLIGADGGAWLATAATADAYKFGIRLELLDGGELVLERWLIEGAWLMSSDNGTLDYANSEAQTITMQVRFDHARNELISNGLGTALGGHINN